MLRKIIKYLKTEYRVEMVKAIKPKEIGESTEKIYKLENTRRNTASHSTPTLLLMVHFDLHCTVRPASITK
jgi:hypothetical protein